MFKQIFSLPLEKKVGQILLVGLPGPEIDSQTKELLSEVCLGEFVFLPEISRL